MSSPKRQRSRSDRASPGQRPGQTHSGAPREELRDDDQTNSNSSNTGRKRPTRLSEDNNRRSPEAAAFTPTRAKARSDECGEEKRRSETTAKPKGQLAREDQDSESEETHDSQGIDLATPAAGAPSVGWRRCATHVALAYYIFYQQRHALLQTMGSAEPYATRYLLPFAMDPMFEAKLLKAKNSSPAPSPAHIPSQQQTTTQAPTPASSYPSKSGHIVIAPRPPIL